MEGKMALVQCPLCKSLNLACIEEIKTQDLISIYQQSIGLDVSTEFQGTTNLNLFCCLDCDLLFFDPMIMGSENFYEKLQKFDWYYMDEKNEYAHAKQLTKNTDRVLEVGSGKGAFRKYIDVYEYLGLEFSQKAVEEAAKEGVNIIRSSVQDFAVSHPCEYDVVCAFQVLEHIAEVNSFIQACSSCIKPGGLLIFSVPSANSFAKYVPNFALDMPPHHVTRWSDQALKNLATYMKLDFIELWHEPLQLAHKNFYAETIFINAVFKILGLRRKSIDLKVSTKAISLLARQVGKIFAQGLLDADLLPQGISVTSVYRKPL